MTPKLCSQTRKAPASQQCLRQRPASTLHFISSCLHALPPWFPTLPQKLMNNSAELSLVTKGASVEEACLLVREMSMRRENKGFVQCLGKKAHGAQWCERHIGI